jgi:membrane-bound lytic murein transglycosylase A
MLSSNDRTTGRRIRSGIAAAIAASLALASCKSTPPPSAPSAPPAKNYSQPLPEGQLALQKIVDPRDYPDFSSGLADRESLLRSIDESLAYFKKPSSKKYFPYLDVSHERAARSLSAFRALVLAAATGEELNREIVSRFDVYRSVGCDNAGTVLYTGYCEPIYRGSLTPTAEYRFPLYKLPPDVVKDDEGKPLGKRTAFGVVPYETREQIEAGRMLEGRGLELVWLRDRLEAYIVHVQGSARILLADGREMRVGYAGKTDRPYRSIGQALVDDGHIRADDLSLTAIKAHFAKSPTDLEHYLFLNESYVFFQETSDGPYGSLGAKVTPLRSIATDKSVFPRGAVAFCDTVKPSLSSLGAIEKRPFRAFVLDQDTGGAIRSAGRCDIFMGTGPDAERLAGHTRAEGKLYYLFLKEALLATAPKP